jgi:hypothetical protein
MTGWYAVIVVTAALTALPTDSHAHLPPNPAPLTRFLARLSQYETLMAFVLLAVLLQGIVVFYIAWRAKRKLAAIAAIIAIDLSIWLPFEYFRPAHDRWHRQVIWENVLATALPIAVIASFFALIALVFNQKSKDGSCESQSPIN